MEQKPTNHRQPNIIASLIFVAICILTPLAAFSPETAFSAQKPDLESIIKMQAKQIKSLTDRLSSLETQNSKLQADIEGIKLLFPASNSQPGYNKAIEQTTIPTEAAVEATPKDHYDAALAALKRNQFIQAETAFAEFIKQYPESNLQSNANFWYAETFFRRKIYNKAAVNFLKSYQQFPQGNKAADSLLKLAIALSHLQKKQEACSMLNKLEKEFPNRSAESIRRAKEARAKYCK